MHNLRLLAAVAGLIVVLAACQGGTASAHRPGIARHRRGGGGPRHLDRLRRAG